MERYHETMQRIQAESEAQNAAQSKGQQTQSTSLADKPKWMTYQAEDPLDYAVNAALYPYNAVASDMTKGLFRGGSMLGLVSPKELKVIEEMM